MELVIGFPKRYGNRCSICLGYLSGLLIQLPSPLHKQQMLGGSQTMENMKGRLRNVTGGLGIPVEVQDGFVLEVIESFWSSLCGQ